jgi:hypothetical protein
MENKAVSVFPSHDLVKKSKCRKFKALFINPYLGLYIVFQISPTAIPEVAVGKKIRVLAILLVRVFLDNHRDKNSPRTIFKTTIIII